MSTEIKQTYNELWIKFGNATHEDENFREFQLNWFFKRFGLDADSFESLIKGRTIIELGTGSGAFLHNLVKAKEVYGLDLTETGIKIATKHHLEHGNIHLICQDLMNHEGQYDIVIADQVLHHLPDTFKALEKAVSLVSPDGQIFFYVYKKKASVREFMDSFIRAFTTRLSLTHCIAFSKLMLWLGKNLTEIHLPLQRWVYWNIIKCFYNKQFSYENNLRVNFDWYSPKIAHRHILKEVMQWSKKLNLDISYIHEGKSGISVKAHVRTK